jgi:hypothetical protein
MYEKPPSREELESWGLTEDDVAKTLVVFEENAQVYHLFLYMQTQWRVGMGGPLGLDYGVAMRKMDRMRLSDSEYDHMEADLRLMEFAALEAMREKE